MHHVATMTSEKLCIKTNQNQNENEIDSTQILIFIVKKDSPQNRHSLKRFHLFWLFQVFLKIHERNSVYNTN